MQLAVYTQKDANDIAYAISCADDSNDLDSLRATNYVQQRHKVYSHMAEDLERKGLQLGGVITQVCMCTVACAYNPCSGPRQQPCCVCAL